MPYRWSPRWDDPPVLRYAALTPHRRRIAELVAQGLDNRQIGAQIGRNFGTVRNTLSVIFLELGIGSREELAALVGRYAGERARARMLTPADPSATSRGYWAARQS